jgi:hypothetical protein
LPAGIITIDAPLKLYNDTELLGQGVDLTGFKLMDNAPITIFGVQTPLIGSKYTTGIKNIKISDLFFDGNYLNQKPAYRVYNTDHGKGFHNFIGLGNMSNPLPTNVQNCEFSNLKFGRSYGDGIRLEGASNCLIHDISTFETGIGHDLIHGNELYNSKIYNINCNMRSDNAIRLRSSYNDEIYNVVCNGFTDAAWSPGIQVESIKPNKTTSKIMIHDCEFRGTFGPGIWLIGNTTGNTDISVYNCLFDSCGRMPANVNLPYQAGIVFEGINKVRIFKNTLVNCFGNAIANSNYTKDVTSSIKGLTATIFNNIFYATNKSYASGASGSGAAIANVLRHYTFTSYENCFYWNKSNLYNCTSTNDIFKDPLFVSDSDFHLQKTSPCLFGNSFYGAYGMIPPTKIYFLQVTDEHEDSIRKLGQTLIDMGLVSQDEISYGEKESEV